MAEWKRMRLEALAAATKSAMATGPFGSAVSSKNFRETGTPMLRGSNLSEDVGVRLLDSELVYLDPELATTFSRSTARRGDLIFTCWGTVGQIGLLDATSRYAEYIVSNKQMKLTPDVSKVDSLFLYYFLSQPTMLDLVRGQAIGSTIPGFNLGQLRALPVVVPALAEQRAIAEVLGALDDKIAANTRVAETSAKLAQSLLMSALDSGRTTSPLADITLLLSRGVTPSYTDEEEASVLILNQKCVRDQRVSLGPARHTRLDRVRSDKLLVPEDVLVNSTGQGTLGRVARWTRNGEATVDSHITIVRFDPSRVDVACAGVAMLALETEIEALGEGSTGQTELSRVELGRLKVSLPSDEVSRMLGVDLKAMSRAESAVLSESLTLSTVRDTLLAQLMSGKLRVKDAEKLVEEVV